MNKMNEVTKNDKIDKSIACLTLGAIGDALGAPVEFMKLHEIRAKYGEMGIQGFDSAYGKLGAITDDTQMTLFLAESLVGAFKRGSERGILAEYWTYSVLGYQRWLSTQHEANANYDEKWWNPNPELLEIIKAQGKRAPGITCLGSLKSMSKPPVPADNDSKGCGTVMRVAPIGIFFGNSIDVAKDDELEEVYSEGYNDAAITHGHEVGKDASGFLAVVYALLLNGYSLDGSIEKALHFAKTAEVIDMSKAARDIAKHAPTDEGIKALGQGWIAEEAVAISLYSALSLENGFAAPHEALTISVNHDGDSDSTGAITGNLIGLMKGTDAIPAHFLKEGSEIAALQSIFTSFGHELIELTS